MRWEGRWMSGDWVYRFMIVIGRAVFSSLRLRRTVVGAEHLDVPGGAVLAITHFSYLDFALTEWALWRQNGRRARFLATARAFEHPIAGPLLRAMRHVPVERTAGTPSYAQAVARLRAGEIIGVFPEGQVHRDDVGPLKTGAVRMAREAHVPLIPVVVWGGQQILTKGHRPSLRAVIGAPIAIVAGEPVALDDVLDPVAASAELRERLRELTRRARELT
jgi:1-acyl-sn-glycerol-3-phosphate acyltransferase